MAKLCQLTWFLHQNKYYLDNDEKNILKKMTALEHFTKNKMEATTKKDIADILAEKFSVLSLPWSINRLARMADGGLPSNYCPIVLTSYLCKTMEHMVNKWLVSWVQQTYHQFSMWIQKAEINNQSCGQIGNLHKRGQLPKATPYSSLWSGEGLWDHLEVWNNEWSA